MSKASDAGKLFLAGILAKLPEAQRAAVQTAFDGATAEDALTLLGDGTLGRSEINKQLDDLTAKQKAADTYYEELNTWLASKKTVLDDYAAIKPEYDRLKTAPKPAVGSDQPQPPPIDLDALKDDLRKEFTSTIGLAQQDAAAIIALTNRLSVTHFQQFSEVLDVEGLLRDPLLGRQIPGQPTGRIYGLRDVYQAKYNDRLAAKDKEAEDARIGKLVEARLAEERKAFSERPYPMQRDSVSALDALTDPDRGSKYTVDSAVAEYERLQSTHS